MQKMFDIMQTYLEIADVRPRPSTRTFPVVSSPQITGFLRSKPKQVCAALLSRIDVFPTLCDLLGFERPAWLEGTSSLPVLRGTQQESIEAIFGEVAYHAAYEPQALRQDQTMEVYAGAEGTP
jgi:hypothetical protein